MTLEGFIIGMTLAGIGFLAIWALGNIGIDKHKKHEKKSNQDTQLLTPKTLIGVQIRGQSKISLPLPGKAM